MLHGSVDAHGSGPFPSGSAYRSVAAAAGVASASMARRVPPTIRRPMAGHPAKNSVPIATSCGLAYERRRFVVRFWLPAASRAVIFTVRARPGTLTLTALPALSVRLIVLRP